jgi:hypothetical protein
MVVRLNNSSGDLRGRGHSKRELGLTAIVDGKSLEKERTETRPASTTSSVENQEALKSGTVIGKLSDAVKAQINDLLANGVVTTGVVVRGIFLSRNELLRVVELSVGAGSHFIERPWLQVKVDSTRDVLASASLREEGVERVITTSDSLVGRHLSIRLDTVLKAVKLPAAVAHLDTSLAEVKGKYFSHD